MAKLKLPFELEKPSNDTYVTQASEIGYGNGSVDTALKNMDSRTLYYNKSLPISTRHSKCGFNSSVAVGVTLDFSQLTYNYRDLIEFDVKDIGQVLITGIRNGQTRYDCAVCDANYQVLKLYEFSIDPEPNINLLNISGARYVVCECNTNAEPVASAIGVTRKLIDDNASEISNIENGYVVADTDLSFSASDSRKNLTIKLLHSYTCMITLNPYASIDHIDVKNASHTTIATLSNISATHNTIVLDENVSYLQVYDTLATEHTVHITITAMGLPDLFQEIEAAKDIASQTAADVVEIEGAIDGIEDSVMEEVQDFLSNVDVIKDKDDAIGWYYNSSYRDMQSFFGAYANGLKAEYTIEANITDLRQSETAGVVHDATIVTKKVGSAYKAYVVATYNPNTNHDYPEANNADAATRLLVLTLNNSGASTVSSSLVVGVAGQTYNEGTADEFTLIAGTGNGTPNAYIVGDVVHILFAAVIDSAKNNWTIIHAAYDTLTDTVTSYNVCKYGSGNLSSQNIYNTLKDSYPSIVLSGSASACPNVNSSIAYDSDSGYYYMAMGNHTYLTHPVILKSNNFINWEFVTIPQFAQPCEMNFEAAVAFKAISNNKYLYVAVRQVNYPSGASTTESRSSMILAKINLSNNAIVQECLIPDDGSRPCFFNYVYGGTNNLYLVHNVQKRKVADFLKINHNYLKNSMVVQQLFYPVNYPSFAKSADNNKCVLVGTQNSRIWLSAGWEMEGVALGKDSQTIDTSVNDGSLNTNTMPHIVNDAFYTMLFGN